MELSRNLRVDSVARLEPTSPEALDVDVPVSRAVAVMRYQRIGCLLVTADERLVGIFTERDLLTRILGRDRPLDTPLRLCMTAGPVTVNPKDSVRTAIRRMEKGGYRHLPVVDEAARPVGILSARRVVHYLVEHFPGIVFNQPPQPNQYPDSAEGA